MSIMRLSMASLPPVILRIDAKVSTGQNTTALPLIFDIPVKNSCPRSMISLIGDIIPSFLSDAVAHLDYDIFGCNSIRAEASTTGVRTALRNTSSVDRIDLCSG